MSKSLAAKEIQCSDSLRPESHFLFLSLGSNPYRITWLRRVRAGVKWSRNLWSLPSAPKFSACLLSIEELSEKWEYAETKANRQRRPNNNSLVIKNNQPGLNPGSSNSWPVEPQGKPKNTGMGSLSLLQQIFLTQESNQGLLHCRQVLYQLSYQGRW